MAKGEGNDEEDLIRCEPRRGGRQAINRMDAQHRSNGREQIIAIKCHQVLSSGHRVSSFGSNSPVMLSGGPTANDLMCAYGADTRLRYPNFISLQDGTFAGTFRKSLAWKTK